METYLKWGLVDVDMGGELVAGPFDSENDAVEAIGENSSYQVRLFLWDADGGVYVGCREL